MNHWIGLTDLKSTRYVYSMVIDVQSTVNQQNEWFLLYLVYATTVNIFN